MKKMCILIGLFMVFSSCSTTKLNSYGKVGNKSYQKIKTQGELVHLKISEVDYEVKPINFYNEIQSLESFSTSSLLIEQVLKIPDYLGKIIKDRKKKYTQTYNTRNTLSFNTGGYTKDDKNYIKLPKLELKRTILTSTILTNEKPAMIIEFTPIIIDDSMFIYRLTNLKSQFTKAKTTEKFPFINVIIEITAIYIDKNNDELEEKLHTTKNIVLPVKNNMSFDEFYGDLEIYSDPLKIDGLKSIEINVTEINPYYLKLEEMESNLDENKDDLTTILTKLTELINSNEDD